MIPWELLGSAPVPGGPQRLTLYRRGQEYSIRIDGMELMNSRVHGSEEALAELACKLIGDRPGARVLVGGLGIGYTVAAALAGLGPRAEVVVSELVPEVVRWNRQYLSHLAGDPLGDGRVSVRETDVAELIRSGREAYDAILLDVDNGPEGLIREDNDSLYTEAGLKAAHAALRPGGVFAVWSAQWSSRADNVFVKRLKRGGFTVQEHRLRARGRSGGNRQAIWLAIRKD